MVPRPHDEMNRILRSDWLPALVPQENFSFWPCKTSFIDQARSVFFGFLLTSTSSRQIKSQKRTCPISSHLYRLCFVLRCIWRQFPSTSPRGACIWRGDLTEGFLRYEFGGGGLIFGGAYTWKSLFSEFYSILHYESRMFYSTVFYTD